MEYDYKLINARNQKFIEAAVLYIEVKNRKGNVSKAFAKKLAAYQLPLAAIIGDKHLGKIAELTLRAVNAALDYIKTRDDVDLLRVVLAHRAADELIAAFSAELDGVDNVGP